MLLDVVDLLAFVLLDDHLVGDAGVLHVADAIHQALLHVELAACVIEVLGGHRDDQVITQGLGPLQQAAMAVVEEIERSVGDDAHQAP